MQYLFKEMLLLHTDFNISMCRTCTIMFSEKNLIYSKYSFSVTMVTQCPSTSGISIKDNILQHGSRTKSPRTSPPDKIPPDKIPPDKIPPAKIPPGQNPPWTKSPRTRSPKPKSPRTKSPRTKSPQTKSPWTRFPRKRSW